MLAFIGSLLVVIGLIVMIGRVASGRFGLGRSTSGFGPELSVLRRVGLGPKQGVATVQFGDRVVLIGVGEGGVQYLCEEEAAATVDEVIGDEDEPALTVTPGEATDDDESRLGRGRRALRLLRSHSASLRILALTGLLVGAAAPLSAQVNGATRPEIAVEGAEEMLSTLQGLAGDASGGAGVPVQGAQLQGPGGELPDVTSILEALPQMSMQFGDGGGDGEPLRLTGPVGTVLFVGFLTIVPTLLLLMTSFTRVLIVLHLLKQAIGAQTVPPAQLLAALALLLTGFIMAPTLNEVNRTALAPWMEGQIDTGEMFEEAAVPFRRFMLANTRQEDLMTFIQLRQAPPPASVDDIPMTVLMSAFVTSEMRAAFQIGFALFLPFLVIDLVVASVLMSMGMFMLPPVLVSLPFKLLLFVMVDGWPLVLGGIVRSFAF